MSMDEPRSLALFPAEVLTDILRYVNAEMCFRVMLCGSRMLNYNMCGPRGVDELRSGHTTDNPRFLHLIGPLFANLHTMSYVSYYLTIRPSDKRCFPPTLTSLELGFSSAEHDWVQWCLSMPDAPNLLPNLRSLTISGSSKITTSNMESCIFPGLQTLRLMTNTTLRTGFYRLLPRSLLHVEIGINQHMETDDFHHLPPHLESFRFLLGSYSRNIPVPPEFAQYPLNQLEIRTAARLSIEDVKNFPPTLVRLTVDCDIDGEAFSFLPPRLERFSYQRYPKLTAHLAERIPRRVKYLSVTSTVEDDAYATLPPALTVLRISASNRPSPGALRGLPSSLTALYFDFFNHSRELIPIMADLPRGLRILYAVGIRLDIPDAAAIPPTLQRLQLSNKDHSIPLESLFYLPKSLQKADLSSMTANDNTFAHLDAFFPSSMKRDPFSLRRFALSFPEPQDYIPVRLPHLNISAGTNYLFTERCLSYIPQTTKQLHLDIGTFWTDACIPSLPQHVTILSFTTATLLTDQAIQLMPATVTELNLPLCDQFTEQLLDILLAPTKSIAKLKIGAISLGNRVIQHLPASCTTLSLKSLVEATERVLMSPKIQLILNTESGWVEKITDEAIATLPTTISTIMLEGLSLSPQVLSVVPHHITYLSLERLANVDGETFRLLPPKLTRLDLPWADSITNSDIAHLPPSLLHLDLRYASMLTDSCIQPLPRTLHYLNLSSAIISDSSAPDLPPLLNTFCADSSTYSERSVSQWPRSLTRIELGDNPRFGTVIFKNLPPNLIHVKWRWTHAMILESQRQCPNINIPHIVLYREGLLELKGA